MDPIEAAFAWLLGPADFERIKGQLGFGRVDDPLTDYERLAIWVYTTAFDYHERINAALWSGSPDPRHLVVAATLRAALAKTPVFKGIVYRGVTLPDIEERSSTVYRPGSLVVRPAFTSTTSDADQVFPGNTRLRIKSRSGRMLGYYSTVPAEREVLFPPETRFRVKGWVRIDSVVYRP